jgi:hypothetical protein
VRIETTYTEKYTYYCDCGERALGSLSGKFVTSTKMRVTLVLDCPHCFRERTYVGPTKESLQISSDLPSGRFNKADQEARHAELMTMAVSHLKRKKK